MALGRSRRPGSIQKEIRRPVGMFDRANAVALARELSEEELRKPVPVSNELKRILRPSEAAE